jgi:exopolyphosphatase/guanosine-5'-triphosphate,3'-diphosphate pyrophosphatase
MDKETDLRNVAVIDVGATAIRMEVAQINKEGDIRTLEKLSHTTNLGRDVFTDGKIHPQTVEQCIKILNGYKVVLQELGITDMNDVWAVGTSAIREAFNRNLVIDRIFNSTRIDINALDIAEIHRLTYNMVRRELDKTPRLKKKKTMVVEIGGGLTEVQLIDNDHVTFSNTYSLGVLRLQRELDSVHATPESVDAVLNQHLKQIEDGFVTAGIKKPKNPVLIAISGDARFTVKYLKPKKVLDKFKVLDVDFVESFIQRIIKTPIEKIVKDFQLTYSQAETLGASMMAYVRIAKYFNSKEIYVTNLNFREGMLLEMVHNRDWTKEFESEVLFSAINLGEKYSFDRKHAECVAKIAQKLYRTLANEHQLGKKYEMILHVSSILHDIGFFISNRNHHKHAFYIIRNSELFGVPENERMLIALIARYHRRALPKKTHDAYQTLRRKDKLIVNKLASILRVADALDRGHLQLAGNVDFDVEDGELIITTYNIDDPTLEKIALKQKTDMFEEVYGLSVRLQRGSKLKGI